MKRNKDNNKAMFNIALEAVPTEVIILDSPEKIIAAWEEAEAFFRELGRTMKAEKEKKARD